MTPRRGRSQARRKGSIYTDLSLGRFGPRKFGVCFVQTKEKMSHLSRTSSRLLRGAGRVRYRRRRCLRLGTDFLAFLAFLGIAASKAVAVRRRLLRENASIRRLALSVLGALVHVVWVLRYHRGVRDVAFVAACWWDENVEPARHHEAREEGEEYDVPDCETHDM